MAAEAFVALGRGADATALADLGAQGALLRFGCIRHAAESRRRAGLLAWAMPFTISKAVIPVAGLGTRFLPATKAMPKEMLPVVDKPAIQYVVEEAVAAGLHDVLMITGRNKTALENHFDRVGELEAVLRAKGDDDKLEKVRLRDRPRRRALRAPGRPDGPRPRGAARQDARRARAVRRAAR